MAIKIRELITTWGFKVDSAKVEAFEKRLTSVVGTAKVVGAAVVGAAGGLFALAVSAARTGDDLQEMAQRTGVSVEALQEIGYAAKLSGMDMGSLETSLRFMSRAMVDSPDKFAKLGVSIRDARGELLPATTVIDNLAAKFAGMPDGPTKTAAAVEVFGRAGSSIIPMLNQGAEGLRRMREEAIALGLVMSAEDAAASDKFMDSLAGLEAAATGMRNTLGIMLLPMIQNVVEKLKAWFMANRELIAQKVEAIFTGIGKALEVVWSIMSGLVRVVVSVVNALGGFGRVATILWVIAGAFAAWQIGALLMSLTALIGALGAVGTAGLIAQLKILALPLVIGALFLLVGAIIEDFVAFFQGRASVIGEHIDGVAFASELGRQAVSDLGLAVGALALVFGLLFSPVLAFVGALGLIVVSLGIVLDNWDDFTKEFGDGLDMLGTWWTEKWTAMKDWFATNFIEPIKLMWRDLRRTGGIGDILDYLGGEVGNTKFGSAAPSPAGAPSAGAAGGSSRTVGVHNEVTVNLGGDGGAASPTAASDIARAVRKELDRHAGQVAAELG